MPPPEGAGWSGPGPGLAGGAGQVRGGGGAPPRGGGGWRGRGGVWAGGRAERGGGGGTPPEGVTPPRIRFWKFRIFFRRFFRKIDEKGPKKRVFWTFESANKVGSRSVLYAASFNYVVIYYEQEFTSEAQPSFFLNH